MNDDRDTRRHNGAARAGVRRSHRHVCAGCGAEFERKAELIKHMKHSPKGSLAVLDLECNPSFRNRWPAT